MAKKLPTSLHVPHTLEGSAAYIERAMKSVAFLTRSRGPIDKRSRARRAAKGKLALGRPSETRQGLAMARAAVFLRARGLCELCALQGWKHTPATDFAHVLARSQGGTDSRYNALATCNPCNLAMQGPFAKGRWVVSVVTCRGVRGFECALTVCAGKLSYQRGLYETRAAGFVKA